MSEAATYDDVPSSLTGGADSIFRTADVVGDAWSWLVMREAVLYRVSRFEEFRTRLGISRSTLSARLARLTGAGVLARPEPGSDYRLTDAGEDFFGCLMATMRWGDRWYFEPGARPQPLTHLGCGHPLEALFRCDVCREGLVASEVTADRSGPFAGLPTSTAGQKRRSPGLELLERERICSIARTLTITGDWWSGLVIRECFYGTRRFDQFQHQLEIAPNILAGRLRRLVELDMLTKVQYQAWPVRQEYRLTEKGIDYYQVPLSMLTWGRRWLTPAGSDAELIHDGCGSALHAVLSCAWCGETISRADVVLG
jgi:DNA-binding HxlR family transcriptional regulator